MQMSGRGDVKYTVRVRIGCVLHTFVGSKADSNNVSLNHEVLDYQC